MLKLRLQSLVQQSGKRIKRLGGDFFEGMMPSAYTQ